MGSVLRTWALPVALAVLTMVEGLATGAPSFPAPLAVTLTILVAAALVLGARRSRPVASAVVASALVTTYLLLLHRDMAAQPAIEPFLVMLVAFFSLGLHAEGDALPLGLAAAGLPLVAAELAAVAAGRPLVDVLPTLAFWGTSLALGRALHARTHEAEVARTRAAEAERLASVAAAEERSRIARELHDVVAHSLSVVVLHAGVERRLLPDDASSTAKALETIESTGRTALSELRNLLGLLHTPGETPLAPLPSLADLEDLLMSLRSAGHDVTVEVVGTPSPLPAGVDLSAYRIVQEALTNAMKHAPGAAVVVRVRHAPDTLTLEVRNSAPPVAAAVPRVDGGGHGLVGMRERVRMYGGELTAEPLAEGGFHVLVRLPREAA